MGGLGGAGAPRLPRSPNGGFSNPRPGFGNSGNSGPFGPRPSTGFNPSLQRNPTNRPPAYGPKGAANNAPNSNYPQRLNPRSGKLEELRPSKGGEGPNRWQTVPDAASNSGKLVFDPATKSWTSPGGLVYGQGPVQHGNRVNHVLDHLVPNPSKATHSIFNVDRTKLIGLLDDAWAKKVGSGVLQPNGNRVWTVDMGRVIGTNGERHIQLVIKDGTTSVITAFPKLMP